MDTVLVELTDARIDVARLRSFVDAAGAAGAVVTFEGITRAEPVGAHGALIHLQYEAYEGMARAMLGHLAREACCRWSLKRVALVHRIGTVPIGDPSVVIAVSSAHRAAAFEACRWLIDELKKSVPIWKKDVFADGFTEWVDPLARSRCSPDHSHCASVGTLDHEQGD